MASKRKMMSRTLVISAAIAVVLLAVAAAVVRTYRRGALSSRAEAGKPNLLAPSPRVDAGKAERPRGPSGAVSEADREREANLRRMEELEASIQAGAFKTPADEARALSELGDLYGLQGEYERELYYLEKAAEKDPTVLLARRISRAKAAREVDSWTGNEQYQLAVSVDNLKEVGLALRMYATHHGGSFPASIPELVEKAYIADPRVLVDPLSGQPFRYIWGLGTKSPPGMVVAKSVGKNGVVARLYVDGHVDVGFEE